MGKGLKVSKWNAGEDDVGIHWIECSKCTRWDIYENFDVMGKYDKERIEKMNLVCRLCTVAKAQIDTISQLTGRITCLENGDKYVKEDSWADKVKGLLEENKMRTREEIISSVENRATVGAIGSSGSVVASLINSSSKNNPDSNHARAPLTAA